jgi:hypothetical protein
MATYALASVALGAVTLHVDSLKGSDVNPGTAEQPLKTLQKAAEKANEQVEPGAMTIKMAAGIYALPKTVVFENHRAFSKAQRLILESAVSPDNPSWSPGRMPAILSTEDPRQPGRSDKLSESYGVKIKMSHVTVRGLKFLGSPVPNNWYCPLECLGTDLKDVVVTQCMFIGNPDTLDIYCAVITDGHQFVVDHCIFSGCHASAVFWDGGRGVVGTGNAMRYCIVEGAKLSAVWTCDTDEDFEFHHNIVTRCDYFWLRKRGTPKTYLVRNSVVTENKQFSGYAVESGATGITGPEIPFEEEGIIKVGKVPLEKDRAARNYLHVVPGAPGADLGAGLFTTPTPGQ